MDLPFTYTTLGMMNHFQAQCVYGTRLGKRTKFQFEKVGCKVVAGCHGCHGVHTIHKIPVFVLAEIINSLHVLIILCSCPLAVLSDHPPSSLSLVNTGC